MTSLQQAERAVEIHTERLADFPNVVGIGVGLAGGDDRPASDSDHAVAVYVTKKVPEVELDSDGVLPGFVEVPGRGETHKVAVTIIEIGDVEVQQSEGRGTTAFSAE